MMIRNSKDISFIISYYLCYNLNIKKKIFLLDDKYTFAWNIFMRSSYSYKLITCLHFFFFNRCKITKFVHLQRWLFSLKPYTEKSSILKKRITLTPSIDRPSCVKACTIHMCAINSINLSVYNIFSIRCTCIK